MAFLSAVIGVRDSSGVRVDSPDSLGNYLPIILKLGANLTSSVTQSGGVSVVTIAAAGAAGVTSVTGTAPIVSSGGATPAISISAANGSGPGSMSVDHYTLCAGATSAATASTLAKRDAAGRFKAVAGVASDDVAVVSQLGGTSWRVAPDSHDLGVWRMDEASSNFANSGADGSLDLVPAGTIAYQDGGPLATGIYLDGNPGTYVASVATTKCQPAALTVWSWVRLARELSVYPIAIAKVHEPSDPGSWSAPYFDWGLWIVNSGSGGQWIAGVNIGGSLVQLISGGAGSRSAIVVGQPHLLALTHDGTTLRGYLDGALVGSAAAPGAIPYGDGPIVRGGHPWASTGGAYGCNGWLGEARVRDEVLTQAQISEIYRRHMGVWP